SAGMLLALRYLYFFLTGSGAGHIQSVILATTLIGMGSLIFLIGIVADLIATNRKLLEKVDWKLRKLETEMHRAAAKPDREMPSDPHAGVTQVTDTEKVSRAIAARRKLGLGGDGQ
ncbi:MAG: hypothetical protein MI806_15990, partial [Minwuiales bacterium]|nr:hypothetical protein [Minwuiales bacterium]